MALTYDVVWPYVKAILHPHTPFLQLSVVVTVTPKLDVVYVSRPNPIQSNLMFTTYIKSNTQIFGIKSNSLTIPHLYCVGWGVKLYSLTHPIL